ncbi:hypothetical protein Flavo103_13190 [Flavobacterium collinsii]|uniref:hypothetical protein n=1 Tax=Flavobacterium collinsii TaxID=1114861 RepID=UPI0022BFF9C1|nr:hypothetical protein [Flavobacterium collinsii]GIQ58183.1 hypothetical protein Flavo103_13190 [Flavobacterium collinsii]
MKIVLENKGIKTDTYYVPPFVLHEGEEILLFLFNGGCFYETEMFLKDIFCGITKNENVTLHRKMTFVEHFKESNFRSRFYPTTVGKYLRKNANLDDPFSKKIFEIEWITSKTKVSTLAGTPRRLLCLYAALSKTKDIIFDLVGQDPAGAEFTFKMVKEAVKDGGSAILLDCFNGTKEHASKCIELEWNDGSLPTNKEFKLNFK